MIQVSEHIHIPPTEAIYGDLQHAYDWFNRELFDEMLPQCLITISTAKKRNLGHYAPNRWEHSSGRARTAELNLNPMHFRERGTEETLSTLVHEMVHLWQQEFGSPGANGYHNKEWGSMMESLGLMPSNTGEPGGKRTGKQMTHYIIDNGPFALACTRLMATGYSISWELPTVPEQAKLPKIKLPGKSREEKTFSCVVCSAIAFAMEGTKLCCGNCYVEMLEVSDAEVTA